jgi:hypothetical protein
MLDERIFVSRMERPCSIRSIPGPNTGDPGHPEIGGGVRRGPPASIPIDPGSQPRGPGAPKDEWRDETWATCHMSIVIFCQNLGLGIL